ncbi:major capsid protein [Chitinibacteraceae bacterium HSL-7]
MPLTMDVFNDDAFGVAELTAAINTVPEGQSVGSSVVDGLFEEEGIATTQVSIERENDTLSLVPAAERGGPGDVTKLDRRDLIPFNTIHLPTQWGVDADEVLGVRAFGQSTELETLQDRVNAKLAKARRRLEATIRYHRIGALSGLIKDANGTADLVDLFARFGLTRQEQALDLANISADAPLKGKLRGAIHMSEDAIGGELVSGYLALCGRGFYGSLIDNKVVRTAFDRWQDGAFLREGQRAGFMYGDIQWQEFYGKVGTVEFIPSDEALLIPLGVPELLITRFAPADYVETVGTNGLPFYAKQELRKFGKGIDGEAQSNVISLCTRPRAIIRLKRGAS